MTKYTVKSGDTMYQISRKYGVSLDALIKANQTLVGSNPDYIEVGWVILIP